MYNLIINIIKGMFFSSTKGYGYYKQYALKEQDANMVSFIGIAKDSLLPRYGYLDKSTELWCNVLEYTNGKFICIYADTALNSEGARFVIGHLDKTNPNKPETRWSGEDFIFRNTINGPRYNNINRKISLLTQKINQHSNDLIITEKVPSVPRVPTTVVTPALVRVVRLISGVLVLKPPSPPPPSMWT